MDFAHVVVVDFRQTAPLDLRQTYEYPRNPDQHPTLLRQRFTADRGRNAAPTSGSRIPRISTIGNSPVGALLR